MIYSDSTTYSEIIAIGHNALENNDVFRIKKRGIAKIFLRNLLELKPDASDFELEENYRVRSPWKKIPSSSEDFWIFIEKEYLNLEVEPQSKFASISLRVHDDLVVLSKNLKYIRQEQVSLEIKKMGQGRLTADERYYRNQLDYFEKKNLVAKDEIVDFMTHGIKWWCIQKAGVDSPPFESSLPGDSPYAFGRRNYWNFYDVSLLDKFSNKFTDLPASHYRKVINECRISSETFKKIAMAYINGVPADLPSVSEKILALVKKSHILASRRQVIFTMLRHFNAKDYISFVSMAPLQIEGIFADICREIGVSEVKLDISSLNDKLMHIEKIRSFYFFEYYSFKFPVLRNLVAHGGLIDGDLEDTAIHLMLDLLPVCVLTTSNDLPIVHAIEVLKQASKGVPEMLVEWIDLRSSVQIPEFYSVKGELEIADKNFSLQTFWDHLQSELNRIDTIEKLKHSRPMKVARKIKSAGLAVEHADKFLRSSARIASDSMKKRSATLAKIQMILKQNRKN